MNPQKTTLFESFCYTRLIIIIIITILILDENKVFLFDCDFVCAHLDLNLEVAKSVRTDLVTEISNKPNLKKLRHFAIVSRSIDERS